MKKGPLVVSIILLPFVMIFQGAILAKLWGWFIQPLGAPKISTAMAIGLMGILTLVFRSNDRARNKPEKTGESEQVNTSPFVYTYKEVTNAIAYDVGAALGALIFGWLVHFFL